MIVACDKSWHKQCFRCTHCDNVISLKGFATIEGLPYCKPHYLELFKTKGSYQTLTKEGDKGDRSSSYNASQGFKGFNPQVLTDVKKTDNKTALKQTETNDKSSPVISPDTKVKKTNRVGFLEEVEKGADLKAPETVKDTSSPKLPAPVKTGDHDQLLKEVGAEKNLKSAESNDRSSPVIETVTVKQVDRKAILKEGIVEHPPQLRNAEELVNDRSAPVVEGVESSSVLKTPPQKALAQQIKSADPSAALKPAAAAAAKSTPPSTPGAASKTNKCAACGKTVYDLEMVRACDKVFHKGCFRCKHCDGVLSLKGFAVIDMEPYCKPHYLEIFKTKGSYQTFADPNAPRTYNASQAFKGY
jgi:hypothetical protein